ncbi:MAG: oligosaccharide flippase family protein [Bacteroidota bacterium]
MRLSKYYQNILTLISGATASQLLLIALTPILSRLFTKEDFGLYGFFLTLLTIGAVLATGRYEVAILLPKKEAHAQHLFSGSLILAFGFALACYCIIPFALPAFDSTTEQSLGWLAYWIPMAIFFQAILNASTFLANRKQAYKTLSYSRFAGSSTTGLISILLGIANTSTFGLIIGKLAGLAVEAATILRPLYKNWRQTWTQLPHNLRRLLRQYQNFPKFSVPEALLNMSHKQLPILALAAYFSLESAGIFTMANTLLSKPAGIVSTAFAQVFYRESTALRTTGAGSLRAFFIRNLLLLLALVALPSLLIICFGPPLFAFFLGEQWREAGVYAQWLMPYLAINFLKTAFSSLVDTANKIRESAFFELCFLLAAILAFYWGYASANALVAIKWYSVFGGLLSVIQLFWFFRLTQYQHDWEVTKK